MADHTGPAPPPRRDATTSDTVRKRKRKRKRKAVLPLQLGQTGRALMHEQKGPQVLRHPPPGPHTATRRPGVAGTPPPGSPPRRHCRGAAQGTDTAPDTTRPFRAPRAAVQPAQRASSLVGHCSVRRPLSIHGSASTVRPSASTSSRQIHDRVPVPRDDCRLTAARQRRRRAAQRPRPRRTAVALRGAHAAESLPVPATYSSGASAPCIVFCPLRGREGARRLAPERSVRSVSACCSDASLPGSLPCNELQTRSLALLSLSTPRIV